MSYKFSTGSIRTGDIYSEDDRTGDGTFIDFDEDMIKLCPGAANAGTLIATPGQITITGSGADPATVASAQLVLQYDDNDYAFLSVNENGSLAVETVDSDGAIGDITLSPDGGVNLFHNQANELGNDIGTGEVVFFGTGSTTAGMLYYLNAQGSWTQSLVSTSSTGDSLLAIALGSTPPDAGMLIRGFFDADSYLLNFSKGKAVYADGALNEAAAGKMNTLAPTGSAEIVRVVGHCMASGSVIYFNPSGDWIELA
jgi:hypothetical protein